MSGFITISRPDLLVIFVVGMIVGFLLCLVLEVFTEDRAEKKAEKEAEEVEEVEKSIIPFYLPKAEYMRAVSGRCPNCGESLIEVQKIGLDIFLDCTGCSERFILTPFSLIRRE